MIIESLGVYLPPKAVSTAEVLKGCKNPVAFPLEKMTGIKSRRMAGETEFSIDLAKKAIADCLERSKHGPADIDLLICCNISRVDGPNHRTSFEPSTAIKLRHNFGLDNAVVFDVSNACAGLWTGIAIAESYLESGAARCALVVSGEYITHLAHTAQKEIEGFMDPKMACLTVGDSGVALTLERSPRPEVGFQALSMYTLGKYSNLCVAKPTDKPHGGAIMVTDPIKSSAIATSQAVMHSTDVMRRSGWPMDSFQHLIIHQTSETALNGAAREINQRVGKKVCTPENVVSNLAERGNTATTTHFVAVMDNILKHKIRSGDRVVFGISGSGQITGAALYVFDDLPERIRQMKLGAKPPAKEPAEPLPRPRRPRVRIESVGVVPPDQPTPVNSVPLVTAAAEDCLARSEHDKSDIDLLVFAGIYRDEFICEPAIAAMATGALQMNDSVESPADKKTFAFDLMNGALGFLNACHVGVQMIQAKKAHRVMVVASEVENNAQLMPEVLRGLKETGSALILDGEGDGQTGFGQFVFRCDTEHLGDFDAFTGFTNSKTHLQLERAGDLEGHILQAIPAAVAELLEREGVDLDRIKAVFPPQLSPDFLTNLAETLDLPRDRFVDIAVEGEDHFTSSLPCTLRHALDKGLVQPGDIGLIISAAAGVQVGCAIYYF